MKQQPLVTIVTPTYNHEKFLSQAIESVLAQTHQNWELCIVDDGSTDRTLEIAESFSDPRIKVKHQENQGLSKLALTYNSALQMSTGELVAILEGDDYWPSNKLEIQVPDFEEDSVVLSSGLFQMVDTQGSPLRIKPDPLPRKAALMNDPIGISFFALLDTGSLTFTWPASTVVRRSTLETIGGFQQPSDMSIVDLPTFARFSLEGRFCFHDKEILGFWRRHPGSATQSILPQQLNAIHRMAAKLLSDNSDLSKFESEINTLDNQWASFQVHRSVLLARLLAENGRERDAVFVLRRALLFRGGAKRKIKAVAGIVAMKLRLNPEPIYRLIGMPPLQEAIWLEGRDPLVDESLFDELPQPIDLVAAAKLKTLKN